jgi:hypothetical protein
MRFHDTAAAQSFVERLVDIFRGSELITNGEEAQSEAHE